MKILSNCNLFFRDYRKSQKSKQTVKQLYGRKTKTAPDNPADSHKILKENLPPLGLENYQ